MTGNTLDDCKKQLKNISKSNKPFEQDGWKPTSAEGATFYRLIPDEKYNRTSKRIDRDVFEDSGLSVLASGGNFAEIDIKQKIQEKNQDIEENKRQWPRKYVGAVKLEPSIFTSGENGDFKVEHDPHPYTSRGEEVHQDPNHFSIVCVKPEELVDTLIDKPDWAVDPSEFED